MKRYRMRKYIYSIFFLFLVVNYSFSTYGWLFLKEFIKHPRQIGSIIPSSQYACYELVEHIRNRSSKDSAPYHILEFGAGTGVVTKQILQNLRPGDTYDIVELDRELAQKLVTFVAMQKYSAKGLSFVRVHNCGCEDFFNKQDVKKHSYHVVITTLPFNSFPVSLVQHCLIAIRDALIPGGFWSYIEYKWFADLQYMITWGKPRQRIYQIKKEIESFCSNAVERKTVTVLRNIPPTNVYHIKFDTII